MQNYINLMVKFYSVFDKIYETDHQKYWFQYAQKY